MQQVCLAISGTKEEPVLFRITKWMSITLLTFGLVLMILLITLLDSTPRVSLNQTALNHSEQSTSSSTRTAIRPLLARINGELRQSSPRLSFTQGEIEDLEVLFQRAFPRASMQTNLTSDGALVNLTVQIPYLPVLPYLNISAFVLPSTEKLDIDTLQIGSVTLDGASVISTLVWFADRLNKDAPSMPLLAAIEQVEMTDSRVTLTVLPLADIRERLRNLMKNIAVLTGNQSINQTPAISYYIDLLVAMQQQYDAHAQVSFSDYLQPLFQAVNQRAQDSNYVLENQAAMWAILIKLSNWKFQNLIGYSLTPQQTQITLPKNIVLAGRRDLFLHFTYSIALKLMADMQFSIAIGEFKEIVDSEDGGSGFSFVDLGADLAGIEFAQRGLDPLFAKTFCQRLAAMEDESMFFPSILDLPEGLKQSVFSDTYGSVMDPRYQRLENEIKQRIDALPLYEGVE